MYLEDVSIEDGGDWEGQFRAARWWTRGWTLQELLAPGQVVFFSREGRRLGDKRELEEVIHHVTGIPKEALRGEDLASFSVDERLRWTNGRQTKKVEDRAYCLLGIFDVSMSLRYGEGDKALARLEAKVRGSQKGKVHPLHSRLWISICRLLVGGNATDENRKSRDADELAAKQRQRTCRRLVFKGNHKIAY